MVLGIVLLVVAVLVYRYSSTVDNPVTRTVVASLALTLGLWGVLSIVPNLLFLVLLVVGVLAFAYYQNSKK